MLVTFLRLIALFILLFGTFLYSFSSEVIIRGNNPDYKGQTIELLTYNSQITNNEIKLAIVKVSENGDFEWRFHSNEIKYVFSHLGVFHTYLFTEPGTTYEVKLPPYTPKKQDEKLNPFFQETLIHLLILSLTSPNPAYNDPKNELNYIIRSFDDIYNPLVTKYAIRTYTYQELKGLDSSVNVLKLQFDTITNSYFKQYYFYRIGLLKFTTARLKSRVVSDDWFSAKPLLYSNPAYMELFNQVYDKYFVYFGRTRLGKKIYTDINKQNSLWQLKLTLAQDNVLKNDTLKELVILKGVHDGFYEMEFSRNGLLTILDSLILTTPVEIHKKIGQDIRSKVTKLLTGFAPPKFELLDKNGTIKNLDDFKGSYVYLNFCTTQNYACLKELEQLKRVNDKYGKYVTVITISVDETLEEMQSFLKRKGYNWVFLHYGNQPEIIKDFDIRVFPTYFLIDRNGKLVWSPAPSPTENFDIKFFQELRSKKIL